MHKYAPISSHVGILINTFIYNLNDKGLDRFAYFHHCRSICFDFIAKVLQRATIWKQRSPNIVWIEHSQSYCVPRSGGRFLVIIHIIYRKISISSIMFTQCR